MKAYEDLNKVYIIAGKAQNYLNCEKCGSLTEYKKRPKSVRWVCTNVECGHSVVEEVE